MIGMLGRGRATDIIMGAAGVTIAVVYYGILVERRINAQLVELARQHGTFPRGLKVFGDNMWEGWLDDRV